MAEYDPDEVDRRFAKLISDEFGEDTSHPGDLVVPTPRERTPVETPREPFNLFEAIEAADPTPEELADARYVPMPLPAMRPAVWQLVGWSLLGLGILVGLVDVFGAPLPPAAGVISGIAAVAGLAMLLGGLLLRGDRSEPPDDDGARL